MRVRNEELSEEILKISLDILLNQDLDKFNIRAIAKEAGVSVGTVYNYFESKDAIILKLTEDYWKERLHSMQGQIHGELFVNQLREIYAYLYESIQGTGGVLMRSLSDAESTGISKMGHMQSRLQLALAQRVLEDTSVRDDVWEGVLQPNALAEFIIANILIALRSNKNNIDFLVKILEEVLY